MWTKLFGLSAFAIRSLSALLGVGVLLSVFALPRSIGWPARAAYTALLASSGALLVYSQDARNYMLSAFFSAWMLALLLRQQEDDGAALAAGRRRLLLLAAAAMLALTHYYGILMVLGFAAVATLAVRSPAAFLRASLRWMLALAPVAVYILLGWTGIATKLDAASPAGVSVAMAFKRNMLRPPQVIVFTHVGFLDRGRAAVDVLQTQLACKAEDWQNAQTLYFVVTRCPVE